MRSFFENLPKMLEHLPEIINSIKGSYELLGTIVFSTTIVFILLIFIQSRLEKKIHVRLFLFSFISFLIVVIFSMLSAVFFAPGSELNTAGPPAENDSVLLTPESAEALEEYLGKNSLSDTPENRSEAVEKAIDLLSNQGLQEPNEPNLPVPGNSISEYSLPIESLTCEPELPSYSRPVTIKKELLNPKHYIQADDTRNIGLSCQIPNDSTSNFSRLVLELALEDQYQNSVDVNVYVDGEKAGFAALSAGKGSKIINVSIKDASTFRMEFKQVNGDFLVANVYFLKAEII